MKKKINNKRKKIKIINRDLREKIYDKKKEILKKKNNIIKFNVNENLNEYVKNNTIKKELIKI